MLSFRPLKDMLPVPARPWLLAGASAICLALLQLPAAAQEFTEGSTTSAPPPPPDTIEIEQVKIPPRSPDWFLSTYRSALLAPLPARIWSQGGIPRIIRQNEMFFNSHGWVGNYNQAGTTFTANNAFFQDLVKINTGKSVNGRTCATCHNPPSGMGLALTNIQARFRNNLNDPLFAPVDGANCPSAVPAKNTAGSLYRGIRGRGTRSLRNAYSMLLTRGLIRIAIPVPQNAEYTVEVLSDKPGCNSDPDFNKDPGNPAIKILSMYRRPIFSASLRFKSPSDTDTRTSNNPLTNVMWDGREPSLRTQAIDATLGHAQSPVQPTAAQVDQIVDFETKFFSAQLIDRLGGRLDVNATGGPFNLSGRSTEPPPPPAPGGPPPPPAFDEYVNWANLTGNARAARQASIARGQEIFNTKPITLANVGGFNDIFPPGPPFNPLTLFPANCSTCHGMPHAGSELVLPPQRDIGVGGQAAAGRFNGPVAATDPALGNGPAPAGDLPVFKFTCNNGATHPFYGSEIITNDPGSGLITGKCADIGKSTVPGLRGLASRAPFFHDGSARDLNGVVNFYDQRFNIGLTAQEKSDLVNFLAAL
ncbi:MAG: hypothetical protein AB7I59_26410 [Geminicoccaceae bacterium]